MITRDPASVVERYADMVYRICYVRLHGCQAGSVDDAFQETWIAALRAYLADRGFTPEQVEAVHSPIGLNLGGQTPEEIAVSIAGEMICVRATRRENAGIKLRGCPMH